jgi:hypothetical protein
MISLLALQPYWITSTTGELRAALYIAEALTARHVTVMCAVHLTAISAQTARTSVRFVVSSAQIHALIALTPVIALLINAVAARRHRPLLPLRAHRLIRATTIIVLQKL